ncbi:MAG: hypothetical protein ACMXYG_05740 [Candidatus Woesearchaeota archaeon]
MLDEPKYWISLITGLIAAFLSGVPLLNLLGWLEWTLPFQLGSSILLWVVAATGAYLLIDSFISEDDFMMWLLAGTAFIILAIAMIQILYRFDIIGFGIPFLDLIVLQVLFFIEGIGLIIAAFGNK